MKRNLLVSIVPLLLISCSSEDLPQNFIVDIRSEGNGVIQFCEEDNCYIDSYQNYEQGTILEIEAIPNNSYVFDQWSNGSNNPKFTLTVNRDFQLTASFVKENLVSKFKSFDGSKSEGGGPIISLNTGYILSGFTTSEGGDFPDHENPQGLAKMFLVKVDLEDRVEWIKVFDEEFFPKIGFSTSDSLIFLGSSNQQSGTIFRSFDFDGNLKVSKSLGVDLGNIYSYSNADGKVLFISPSNNNISELDGDGNLTEFFRFEGEDLLISAFNKTTNGNLIIVGRKNIPNQRVISVNEVDFNDKSIIKEITIDYGNSSELWVDQVISISENSFIIGGTTNSRYGIFENDLSFEYNYNFILKYSFDENFGWIESNLLYPGSLKNFQVKGGKLIYSSYSSNMKEMFFNRLDIETGELLTKMYRSGGGYANITDLTSYQNGFILSGAAQDNQYDFSSISSYQGQYAFFFRIDDNGSILE